MFLFEYSLFSLVSLLFLDFPTDSGGSTAVGIAAAAISDVNNVPAVTGLPAFCCWFHGSVERPDPKGLSTFLVSAPSSCRTGDSNSCSPDLELGALTKWLASRC